MCHIGRFTLVSGVFISSIHYWKRRSTSFSKEHSWYGNALISIDCSSLFTSCSITLLVPFFKKYKQERSDRANQDGKEGKLITYFESIQVVYRNLSPTLYQRVCRFRCSFKLSSFALFFCHAYAISVLCGKLNFLPIWIYRSWLRHLENTRKFSNMRYASACKKRLAKLSRCAHQRIFKTKQLICNWFLMVFHRWYLQLHRFDLFFAKIQTVADESVDCCAFKTIHRIMYAWTILLIAN